MSAHSLIIFAKQPRAGDVKTRLGATVGMKEAAEIYRTFAEHAFALGRQLLEAGTSVSIFHDPRADKDEMRNWVGPHVRLIPQEGATLGERMRRAFDLTFAGGSQRAVIIGTDVPELDRATIDRAFAALAHHDVVIGPSHDGGYYLLGMNAPTKPLFDGIAWGEETVSHDTVTQLHRLHLTFVQLPMLADIDTISDYRAYLGRMAGAKDSPAG